jgi:colanic acid/amylovoran biosynthesis glycosyltransferase
MGRYLDLLLKEEEIIKKQPAMIRVLTITARFPSLIQPWLVGQLVQIIKNGGSNSVLARKSETDIYSSDIDSYNLLDDYQLVPDKKGALVLNFIRILLTLDGAERIFRGALKFPRVLFSNEFTLKEKLFSFFLLPCFGLKGIDIIHSHSEMAGNTLLPVVLALDVPLVITFHGLPPTGVPPITPSQRQRYTRLASVILVNTEFAKDQYASLGVSSEKIEILPQGTNLESFPFRPKPFPSREIHLLTVGRFHPDKGQKYALEAVSLLIKKGIELKYHLVGNGPQRAELETLAKELGIESNVSFYSQLSDSELRDLYSLSHIFVLPSLRSKDGFHEETQGVVLQEAQASGLITICTKTGGIPECIDDNISGFLVDDRSSKVIAEKIFEVISEPDRWGEYQTAGRKWVQARYDVNVIGEKTNQIYRKLSEPTP